MFFVFARKRSDEAISREGEFPQGIYFITLVVGYFAALNMTYFFLHVILNDSEESHRVSEEYILYEKPPSREFAAPTARKDSILGLAIIRWDISLALNMT